MNYTQLTWSWLGHLHSSPSLPLSLGLTKDKVAGRGFMSEHSAPHLSLLMTVPSLGSITSVLGHGLRSVSVTVCEWNSSKLYRLYLSF